MTVTTVDSKIPRHITHDRLSGLTSAVLVRMREQGGL